MPSQKRNHWKVLEASWLRALETGYSSLHREPQERRITKSTSIELISNAYLVAEGHEVAEAVAVHAVGLLLATEGQELGTPFVPLVDLVHAQRLHARQRRVSRFNHRYYSDVVARLAYSASPKTLSGLKTSCLSSPNFRYSAVDIAS